MLVGALRPDLPVDDVVQESLFDDPLAIVARRDHPLAGKRRLSRERLAAQPWVVPRRGTPTRSWFDTLFDETSGPYPAAVVEASSLVLIRGILLHSDRLTIISARQVRYEVELGLLRTLAFDLSHTMRTIGMTLRSGWQPTAVQSRFLDLLRNGGREPSGR